jgi:predicted MFS family arabinose efflux permease
LNTSSKSSAFPFSKGFVSCTLNAKYVGLVLIAYGICDSIGSLSFGQLVKYIGRWPCFVIAGVINYSLIITMFNWKPSDNQIAILFVIAGLWGLADAVWQTQINAFYGVLFVENDEAAFSNYRLWESIGFVLFYIITPYIRIRIALIILLIFLTFGMLGYGLIEYRWKRKPKQIQIISS